MPIAYTLSGTATNGTDYQSLSGSVTILAGNTSADITLTPTDDGAVEGNESVWVNLSASFDYTVPPMQGTASISITDDDCSVSVTSSGMPSESGPTNGTYTISRTGYTGSAIDVAYTMSGGAGSADYSSLSGTVSLGSGQTTATVTLTPIDDGVYEGMESAILTLGSGTGYAVGTPSSATLSIMDNDSAPTVSVTASGSPAEGGATGAYTISRTGSTDEALTVNVSMLGGSASSGDYSSIGSTVSIPAGQSSATVTLTAIDDDLVEGLETALLSLGWSSNYSVSMSAGSATLNIADNEFITVTADSDHASEQGPTARNFTFTRPGSTSGSLTINYVTSGTASMTDYSGPMSSVTIPAGASSATVTMTPYNDGDVEGPETVIVTLSSSSNYTPSSSQGVATLMIDDNDFVTVSASGSPSEQGPATGTYTFTRPGSTAGSLALTYVMSGEAINGTDYAELSGSVTIASGQSTATVTLTPTNDTANEGSETAILTLSAGAGYTPSPTAGSATHTILDNEVWVTSSGNPSEQDETPGTYTFHRSGPTTAALLVSYSVGGSANSVDYLSLPTSDPNVHGVVIPAGQSSVEVLLEPLNDSLREGNETAILTVSASSDYTIADGASAATLTIEDNDEWIVGLVALGDETTLEGGTQPGQFVLYRAGESDVTHALTVVLAIATESTASGDDHDFDYESYEIPAGDASVVIDVTATNDALREEAETLVVEITASDDYAIDSEGDSATLTILDNDQWTVDIVALVGHAFEAEELPGSFLITRSGQSDTSHALSVSVEVNSASTAGSADYDAIFETYEIPAGQTSLLVPIVPVDDSVTESSESLILDLMSNAAYSLADADSATVSIHDQIFSGWNTVGISAPSTPATELGMAARDFTISRTGPTTEPLTVGYHVGGNATPSSDYESLAVAESDPPAYYVTIPAGQSSVTLTVSPVADEETEGNETVTVSLSTGGGEAVSTTFAVGAVAVATMSIVDSSSPYLYAMAESPHVTEGDSVVIHGLLTAAAEDRPENVLIKTPAGVTLGEAELDEEGRFEWTYAIADDNPTTTPQDEMQFVIVPDDGGELGLSANVLVMANNVPPTATIQIVDPTDPTQPGDEIGDGGQVGLILKINDVGLDDTFTIQVNWGDGKPNDNETVTERTTAEIVRSFGHTYEQFENDDLSRVYPVTVTITDDDSATTTVHSMVVAVKADATEKPEVYIVPEDSTASEVNTTSGWFWVARTGSTTKPLAVRLGQSGDAGYADYNLWSTHNGVFGAQLSNTVVIPTGSDKVAVYIIAQADQLDEGPVPEVATFTVIPYMLGLGWTPYTIRSAEDHATISIEDGFGKATIEIIGRDEMEEDAEYGFVWRSGMQFKVTLWGASPGTSVTVPISFGGTAELGQYEVTSSAADGEITMQVYWDTPRTTATFRAYPVPDLVNEVDDETIIVSIESGTNVTPAATNSTATATILNDDDRELIPLFHSLSANESNGDVQASVRRLGGSKKLPQDVFLDLTGTATESIDYNVEVARNGDIPVYSRVVHFAAGQSVVIFRTKVVNDRLIESTETVILGAMATTAGEGASGAPSTLSIADNDGLSASWESVDGHPFPQADAPDFKDWKYNAGEKQWERIKIVYEWQPPRSVTTPWGLTAQFGQAVPPGQSFSYQTSAEVSDTITWGAGVSIEIISVSGGTEMQATQGSGYSLTKAIPEMPAIPQYKYYLLPLQRNVYYIKQFASDPTGDNEPSANSAGEASVTQSFRLHIHDSSGRELLCDDDMNFVIYKRSEVAP